VLDAWSVDKDKTKSHLYQKAASHGSRIFIMAL